MRARSSPKARRLAHERGVDIATLRGTGLDDAIIAKRPMMTLTLASDHRVVDGARAAKFLDALARLIEEPWALLA